MTDYRNNYVIINYVEMSVFPIHELLSTINPITRIAPETLHLGRIELLSGET